ncbi:hypothetical protein L842_4474 [Mycobacterium intracellulare MIN_052511_1280]|nr:hypothetical protein L842_4474 [Mycobacterium intracellulare MIN_052511_1280]
MVRPPTCAEGVPGHRDWDGLRWTSWTNPPSPQPFMSPS